MATYRHELRDGGYGRDAAGKRAPTPSPPPPARRQRGKKAAAAPPLTLPSAPSDRDWMPHILTQPAAGLVALALMGYVGGCRVLGSGGGDRCVRTPTIRLAASRVFPVCTHD